MEIDYDALNRELDDAYEWLRQLPASDDRLRVLTLLHRAYAALNPRTIVAQEYPDTEVWEAIGEFLYPDDGVAPQIRMYRRATPLTAAPGDARVVGDCVAGAGPPGPSTS